MLITLVDVKSNSGSMNKDLAGGFGTASTFGNTPFLRFLTRVKKGKVNIPIMAFGYLSAILKERGYDVRLSRGELVEGTDVYIVSTSTVAHGAEMEFAQRAKGSGALVGFVGSMCSALPDMFLPMGDFVIRGEAENVLYGTGPEGLSGVVDSGFVEDLDNLPFPDWSIFEYDRFSYSIYLKDKPVFPILSSRGCPYPCGYYCPYPSMQGKRFRPRAPENVIEEIRYLVENYGARGLLFRDPVFTFDMDRAVLIAEGIIKNGFDVRWVCETSPAHLLRHEQLELMRRAGLRGINIGIESADPDVLKASKRAASPHEYIFELVGLCKELGIRVGAFYTIGNMADTKESIEKTIRFAKALNTPYAQFTIATPYPGTDFNNDVKDLISSGRWDEFDGYTPVFKHPALTCRELLGLKEKAMRSYYLRLKWLLEYLGII